MNNLRASGITGLLRLTMVAALAVALGALGWAGTALAGQQVFNTSNTWTPDTWVTKANVQAWGGGGAGSYDNTTGTVGGTGGGGGGYAKKSGITVTPGVGQSVVVGAGGTSTTSSSTSGGDSYFINTSTVLAKGGVVGAINNGTPGAGGGSGGAGGTNIGDVTYAGGSGSSCPSGTPTYGGGGGGSAGTAANGNPATNTTTGATAVTNGGAGGNGGAGTSVAGSPGGTPGGGGGGAGTRSGASRAGGAGGAGQVIVGWGPNVTVTKHASQSTPTNTSPILFTVVFSEEVSGFDTTDITLSGGAGSKFVGSITPVDTTTYTVSVNVSGASGTVIATINPGRVTDLYGNQNDVGSTSTAVDFSSATNPGVTIAKAAAQSTPTKNLPVTFTVDFSEQVNGFAAADVDVSDSSAPGAQTTGFTTVDGPNGIYNVTVTATNDGDIIAKVPAGVVTSASNGLGNTASPGSATVTYDATRPGVTITSPGLTYPTSPMPFTVTFNEPVTGFATTDVTLSGSGTIVGASVSSVVPSAGPASVYTVNVAGTYDGEYTIAINDGAALDAALNTSTASAGGDDTTEYTGGSCYDASTSSITVLTGQTVSGLAVNLSALYTPSGSVTGVTYKINGSPVDTPWNSAAYGIDGPQSVALTVEGIDPDCGYPATSDTENITVDNSAINYLTHSSATTGSSKWPTAQSGNIVNGWGIVNAQYGEFTCATCHSRNPADTGSNIKRIRSTITAPNSPTDNFPGSTVVFTTATAGSSHYGDDSIANRSTSNRICEVCHSKNKFHNYNVANNTANGGNLTHANKSDCIICHQHKQGFASPSCSSCHGNPPTSAANLVFSPEPTGAIANAATAPGAHAAHAITRAMNCETCHKGNTMPEVSSTIEMGIHIINTNWPGFNPVVNITGGTLSVPQNSRLSGAYLANGFVASDGVTTLNKVANDNFNCTVYCHGNWTGNGGSNNNPSWVATGQAACGTCHGAGSSWPTTGSHVAHVSTSGNVKLTCNKCHPTYTDTTHVNGNVAWQLATADTRIGASATYTAYLKNAAASGSTGNKAPSSTYGTCNNVYCHGANSPNWLTDIGSINCNSCHSASSALLGSHNKHYSVGTIVNANSANNLSNISNYVFGCGNCHDATGTTHAGGPVPTTPVGVSSAEVDFSGLGSYAVTNVAVGSDRGFSYTAGTCGFNSCHNDGKASPGSPLYNAVWTNPGAAFPTNCTGCHRGDSTSGLPMNTSGHTAHVSAGLVMSIKPCQMCHDATVDADNRVVTDKSKHVNGTRDIAIVNTWDSGGTPTDNWNGTSCSNVYCHSSGKATPTYRTIAWSSGLGCADCHGNTTGGTVAVTDLSTSHLVHVGTNSSDSGKQFGYSCAVCHVQTASSNTAIGTPANHINKLRDVAVANVIANVGYGGTGLINNDYGEDEAAPGSCGTIYCHGTRSPDWTTGTTNDGNCKACHDTTGSYIANEWQWRDTSDVDVSAGDLQVGAHAAHLNAISNYSLPLSCDSCHNVTLTAMAAQTTYVANVRVAGHIDTANGAEVTWSSFATAGETYGTVANYDKATGVCTAIYCHGGTLALGPLGASDRSPVWGNSGFLSGVVSQDGPSADCNKCHGSPPPGKGHDQTETLSMCGNSGCHDETMNEGFPTFKNLSKHINGVVDNSAVCSTCHPQMPPAQGSHPKHGMHLIQQLGMSDGDPNAPLTNWTASNYQTCSICHDMTVPNNHLVPLGVIYMMGSAKADQRFTDQAPAWPVYNNAEASQSCTNAKCHFVATPKWEP